VSASLSVSSRAELSIEHVLGEVGGLIAADSMAGAVNIKKLKEDYEAAIAAAKAAAARDSRGGAGGVSGALSPKINLSKGLGRKTAAELGIERLKPDAALSAVRDEHSGSFNWAMWMPTEAGKPMQLLNAGSLSVPEMSRFLTDELACYALLRLSFGHDKFRRTKFVMVSYCGPRAPVSLRGKVAASKAAMRAALSPVSCEMQVSDKDGLSLQAVIDKVRAASVLDGDVAADSHYTVEAFLEGLEEEALASAQFFGDEPGAAGGGVAGRAPADVVDDLRKGAVDFALFTVRV
jgi:hypothetical protein